MTNIDKFKNMTRVVESIKQFCFKERLETIRAVAKEHNVDTPSTLQAEEMFLIGKVSESLGMLITGDMFDKSQWETLSNWVAAGTYLSYNQPQSSEEPQEPQTTELEEEEEELELIEKEVEELIQKTDKLSNLKVL